MLDAPLIRTLDDHRPRASDETRVPTLRGECLADIRRFRGTAFQYACRKFHSFLKFTVETGDWPVIEVTTRLDSTMNVTLMGHLPILPEHCHNYDR
jgi:hypothetical protein